MSGAILELVTNGVQDEILTDNPEITFFKRNFRRHSVFSSETINIRFRKRLNLGQKSYCYLDKKGDILSSLYLVIDLPKITTQYNSLSTTNNDEILLIRKMIKDKRSSIKDLIKFQKELNNININLYPLTYHDELLKVYQKRKNLHKDYQKIYQYKHKFRNISTGTNLIRRFKRRVYDIITKNNNIKRFHQLKTNKKLNNKNSNIDVDKLANYWFSVNDFIEDSKENITFMNFLMRNYIDTFNYIYLWLINKDLPIGDDNLFVILIRKNRIKTIDDVITFINTYLGEDYQELIPFIENNQFDQLKIKYKKVLKEFIIYDTDISILELKDFVPLHLEKASKGKILEYIHNEIFLSKSYNKVLDDYIGIEDLLEEINLMETCENDSYYEIINEISKKFVSDELLNIVNVDYYSNTISLDMKLEWESKLNELLNKLNNEKLKLISRLQYLKKKEKKSNFRWVNNIGIKIIKSVKLIINGQTIDEFDSDLLDIYLKQFSNRNINKMIGNIKEIYQYDSQKKSYRLFIPLPFWINQINLPIVALKYSSIKLEVELKKLEEIAKWDHWLDIKTSGFKASILANYHYVDFNERNTICNQVMEQLIVTHQSIKYDYYGKNIKHGFVDLDWHLGGSVIEFIIKCKIKNRNIIICDNLEIYFNDLLLIKQDYEYYHSVLPCKLRNTSFDENYLMYSFALNPKDVIQPSGTLSASKQRFRFYLTQECMKLMTTKDEILSVSIYARCYDIFKIGYGYGGFLFE